jgi:hypothetical protein
MLLYYHTIILLYYTIILLYIYSHTPHTHIQVKEMIETRAEVMAAGSFDEKKVLNGMRQVDLEKHLE